MANYQSIYDEIYNRNKSSLDESIEASKKKYDLQTATVNENYDKVLKDTQEAYDEAYRNNAVQKMINERALEERTANMGLLDSGLNRTQQTAVQLGYSNQKAEIDRARRKAIDSVMLEKTGKINEIETNRIAEQDAIKQNYNSQVASNANSVYKAELDNEAAIEKARLEQAAAIEKARLSAMSKSSSSTKLNKSSENVERFIKNMIDEESLFEKAKVVTRGDRGNTGNGGYKYEGITFFTYPQYVESKLRKYYDSGILNADELISLLDYYGI